MTSLSYRLSLFAMFLFSFGILSSACSIVIPVTRVETIVQDEYYIQVRGTSFIAPAEIPTGRIWITLENQGEELHHVQFMRLNNGFTLDQFFIEMQTDPDGILAKVDFVGGVGMTEPGKANKVLIDLEVGQYVLADFLPNPEGIPHLAVGMLSPLKVVPGPFAHTLNSPGPEPALPITLKDYTIQMPTEITRSPQLWKVTNNGPEPHEIILIRLNDGKTMDDVAAYMISPVGPPPFLSFGGMQALSPGKTGWLHVDLLPGIYAAICVIPEPLTGHSHAELGMVATFEVKNP